MSILDFQSVKQAVCEMKTRFYTLEKNYTCLQSRVLQNESKMEYMEIKLGGRIDAFEKSLVELKTEKFQHFYEDS